MNPISASDSIYLEEAIAVAFSLRMVSNKYGKRGLEQCRVSSEYREAIRRATRVDYDIVKLGKKVRGHINFGSLSLGVTPDILRELYPNPNDRVLTSLVEKFPEN